MNLQPYTGHKAPGRLRCDDSTELGKLDYRLRLVGEDLMIDAADMLKVITKERDAADARVKILEAEQAVLRADRDRLAGKNQAMREHIEARWNDFDRNRNALLEIIYDGAPEPVMRSKAA